MSNIFLTACTLPGIALVGGDLPESDGGGGIRAADPPECRFECNRRAQCRFWSYVEEWEVNCYLKEVAGDERQMEGAVTGWKGDGCGEPKRRNQQRLTGSGGGSVLEQKLREQEKARQGLLNDIGK